MSLPFSNDPFYTNMNMSIVDSRPIHKCIKLPTEIG